MLSLIFFLSCTDICADTVDEFIKRMTLEQKIGQFIMAGFQGQTLGKQDISLMKKINPGGLVFYARNFKDASDISLIISRIRTVSENHGLPLFFAIDQEGGVVHRIRGEFYKPPSAVTIGAANSELLAREVGFSVGDALGKLGININLAPVLDMPSEIMSSPMTQRSYSNDSKTVERLGVAYIKGLQSACLLSAAKHFPGLGKANEDSHHVLPRIEWKIQEDKDNDLMPFKGAIKSGVDMIMVGHFIAEPGDAGNPASLSSYWIKEILRNEMGFDGLIIVDNIEMKPIKDMMPIPRAAVESFKAGADIIMVSHESENQAAVFEALKDAVGRGEISAKRLNESLKRIIDAKRKIMSCKTDTTVNKNLKDISKTVAEHAIVGIKLKDAPHLPINREGTVLYAGNNLTLLNLIKETFRHAESLSTSLVNYKKINPDVPIGDFVRRFDALIIDADYSDAQGIISLCKDLNLQYFVLQIRLSDIQKTVERLKPGHMIIIFEVNSTYLEFALEIICGKRQTKGRLPFNPSLPADYIYTTQ